jgi:hypothetical protein
MNGWSYLEKIRSRSQDEKKILALFISLGLTAVIAISWGTIGLSSFLGDKEDEEKMLPAKTASPVESLGSQAKSLKEQLSEVSASLKPIFSEDPEATFTATTSTSTEVENEDERPQLQYLQYTNSTSTTTASSSQEKSIE